MQGINVVIFTVILLVAAVEGNKLRGKEGDQVKKEIQELKRRSVQDFPQKFKVVATELDLQDGPRLDHRGLGRRATVEEDAVSDRMPVLPDYKDQPYTGIEDSAYRFTVVERNANSGSGGDIRAGSSSPLSEPALQGTGISFAYFELHKQGAENLPHYHPRATELLFLIEGQIEVAFVTAANKLVKNVLNAGEATVFPTAMLHYQRNLGTSKARYVSVLNSENPGVVSFPRALAALPYDVLETAFRQGARYAARFKNRLMPTSSNYDGMAGPGGTLPTTTECLFGFV